MFAEYARQQNIHVETVEGFGREWGHYDQSALGTSEAQDIFHDYFGLFDFTGLGEGFDLGCGSGRWARFVAPQVGKLHCIDPSDAIEVARRNLADCSNVEFHRASADAIPVADQSQDFGYCLGVLHHIPDPQRALDNAVRKLKPGAQMLVYIYYALDNRSLLYRAMWRASNSGRRIVSRLPFAVRRGVTEVVAATVYWPLARSARLVERLGGDPSQMPLSAYRSKSFYTMRTDALDRFGTRLEQRFSRDQIEGMMKRSGLGAIRFSDSEPYWVAVGRKLG